MITRITLAVVTAITAVVTLSGHQSCHEDQIAVWSGDAHTRCLDIDDRATKRWLVKRGMAP